MNATVGRGGGGGHGGGHGHGGRGGGWGFPYVAPYWEEPADWSDEPVPVRVVHGQELLSSGEGALLVLALVWWLTHEADKRVPR